MGVSKNQEHSYKRQNRRPSSGRTRPKGIPNSWKQPVRPQASEGATEEAYPGPFHSIDNCVRQA